jgi:hypothetical protein
VTSVSRPLRGHDCGPGKELREALCSRPRCDQGDSKAVVNVFLQASTHGDKGMDDVSAQYTAPSVKKFVSSETETSSRAVRRFGNVRLFHHQGLM